MNINEVIAERTQTHGDFKDVSMVAQSLKGVLHHSPNWKRLNAHQMEALEMIEHKIARILSGDPHFKDAWVDIAGYAQLVARELE